MAAEFETTPVGDSVAKVNNEIAVGSDLEFQRHWWRFERIVWISFGIIVFLDVLGMFGRGPIANAKMQAPNGDFTVKYERIERFRTPSILSVLFSPSAIHNGQVKLWVCEKFVDPLGNQRIIPQPTASVPMNGGILYTFPMSTQHVGLTQQNPTVQFALEPGKTGIYKMQIGSPDAGEVSTRIFVLP